MYASHILVKKKQATMFFLQRKGKTCSNLLIKKSAQLFNENM
jgi:hypothetical protein